MQSGLGAPQLSQPGWASAIPPRLFLPTFRGAQLGTREAFGSLPCYPGCGLTHPYTHTHMALGTPSLNLPLQ